MNKLQKTLTELCQYYVKGYANVTAETIRTHCMHLELPISWEGTDNGSEIYQTVKLSQCSIFVDVCQILLGKPRLYYSFKEKRKSRK